MHALELPELRRRRRLVVLPRPYGAAGEPRGASADRQPLPTVPPGGPVRNGHSTPRTTAHGRWASVPPPVQAAEDVPVAPAAPGVEAGRIDLLERRLSKLARLIEERNAQLPLRNERGAADTGVASVYSEVQGLRGQSEEDQRKRTMMASIFEANRKLRERIGSAAREAE